MDKKSNHYSRQGSGKTLQSSEQSRKTDVSKQLPRNARRRENPNQSYIKQDPARTVKNQFAKNRPNVDKRPKPRGVGNSNSSSATTINLFTSGSGLALDGAASAGGDGVTNDDLLEVELNSIYLPGSRKQNLNHLLNFNYASRDFTHGNAGALDAFSGNRSNNRGGFIKRHKYNKEQFLQANFQFVLKYEENIQHNIASPDTLVDWNLIEQINIQAIEEPQCPICLYPPVAAKLTRCGHAYCWPCILHYLALSDKTWRKCPICYEAVHIADLKSTSIIQHHDWKVGDLITMHLMRRERGSMFIEQVGESVGKLDSIPHLRDNPDTKKFTKFLLADPIEVQMIIDREKKELLVVDDINTPESIFVKQALDLLQERENSIGVKKADSAKTEGEGTVSSEVDGVEASELLEVLTLSDQVSSSSSDILEEPSKVINDDGKYHYFYQSTDGQNIYMHSLNVKILQAMYGLLDKCPCVIEAKIIEKHSYSMNEDLRKKLRYLQHLPLTCQFEVVELQFEPPAVSPEVLGLFKDEIIMRQNSRMRRAREERKRERQINEINERQMGKVISRSANIDINSSKQFPSCGYDDFLLSNSIGDFPQSLGSDMSSSPPPPANKMASSTSFAKMLSSPKRDFWPSLGCSNGGENVSAAGAWGKPSQSSITAKSSATPTRPVDRILESDSLEELYDEHFSQSLGEVIVEAIQQKKTSGEINKDSAGTKNIPSGNSGCKKGKKNKKMLLFSTGMNHKGN